MKRLLELPAKCLRASAAMALVCCVTIAAHAGLLQTQSNPVNFGGVYWGNPTNWDNLGIPHYQLDTPNDGTHNRDINFVSIAHDAYYFYVRISFNQAPLFNGSDFYLWLDTDLNSATGTRNFSGNGSIGSEYVVSGGSFIQDPSAWNFDGWVNWDNYPWDSGDLPRDVIISINRSTQLPGITAFNFTYQLYNSGDSATGDWYPDSADSLTGSFFQYRTGDLPAVPPAISSAAYKKLVLSDGPAAYYRLNETAPFSPDVATNSGSLGTDAYGVYTLGVKHPVPGAIVGDSDTAARFSAVDSNSIDGGVPTLVPWPEHPRVRELWDNVGIGNLDGKGSGTSSLGLDNTTSWHVNLGHIIRVAQDFDITTPPGPPYNRGQRAGLWVDTTDLGGLAHMWDTRSWATRKLAAGAGINFAADGEYWISFRLNNGGDTAMGVGVASAGDGSGQFAGIGAMWDNAGGGSANNALYISDGNLGTDSPYTIRTNSFAGLINGRGLVVARLTTTASGSTMIDATVFQPGDTIPSDPSNISWLASYNSQNTMLATHLLLWLNGNGDGELDAIRLTTNYAAMFQGEMNLRGSFTVEAWLKPAVEGAGNAQSPLFNRDPNDVANREGWDFFQRSSGTGWNFRMFNGSGTAKVFDITGGPYTVGQWCHLVAVYDASIPSATLYLNGQQAATSSSPNGNYEPTPYAPLSIGGYSDASQNPFIGNIDEVATYTNALSPAQVLAHYQNGTNASRSQSYSSLVQSHGAVAYLRLNEPARNVATNSGALGSTVDGVYDAFVDKGRSGPLTSGFEAFNTAGFFNGANSYVELRNPPELNFTGPITLEAWVQPAITAAAPGGFGDIIAHGYDEDFNEVALRVDSSSGTPQYSISTYSLAGGQGVSANIPAADLGTGAWVHLAATFDGANWNLYRNGSLVGSANDSSGAGSLQVLKGNWAIGARGRWAHMDVLSPGLDRQFAGKIDEAAIYTNALSANRILNHYLVGANGLLLSITRSNNNVILTWPGGTLQEATNVTGPYTDLGVTSPYPTSTASAAKKFYRVRF